MGLHMTGLIWDLVGVSRRENMGLIGELYGVIYDGINRGFSWGYIILFSIVTPKKSKYNFI